MKITSHKDTIISPITSTVGGSVSLIRISGSDAFKTANRFFKGKDLKKQNGGTFHFGKLIDQNKEVIDEVVVLLYKTPHSFTGEDVVEISCHGNPFIIDQILELFTRSGCRLSEPGEFTKRAFLNNKIDLVQAEAVADLISAKSRKLIKYSLENIDGKLSNYFQDLKSDLINIASQIELDLDFSEEDLDIITHSQVLQMLEKTNKKIQNLMATYKLGKTLNKGIEVLITGKPNVGKSSLMNSLLGKNRVIVSSLPGTTRDAIHEDIIINNIMVRFIDTAGIHLTDDQIEAEGVDRARNLFDQSDLILLVIDISKPLSNEDYNLIQTISSIYKEKLLILGNKADLDINAETMAYFKNMHLNQIQISALKNINIDYLKDMITAKIQEINTEIKEDLVITNQRQVNILSQIMGDLESASTGLEKKMGFEFIAVDLRNAIDHLSEITGEISTDDILNNIFSSFCIGK